MPTRSLFTTIADTSLLPHKIVNSMKKHKDNGESSFGAMKETFVDMSSLAGIVSTIIYFSAIYLAFKCKSPTGGIDFMQLLFALCCAPFYLLYRLAVPCK